MILMIDNYDSFTYNLVQYMGELGADIQVFRNDCIDIAGIEKLKPEKIMISPGPCTPEKAGVSKEVIKHFSGKLPVFGVCLGHQSIIDVFGGKIIKAAKLMHGKTSEIHHDGQGVFKDLPNPFVATRYHSLIADPNRIPEGFYVTAWADGNKDEIMGVRHKTWQLEGVQFHPESILTESGKDLLKNFLDIVPV